MAKPKRKIGMCTVMVACDGNDLYHGRTVCLKCEETMRKKQKVAQKGAVHAIC